ncbi:MAG: tyrosine-protein phosphatase [Chitinophagaceae bacterium]|nr:tyrosine-protein phosphatase [Anaerolineae bacterium]
MRFFRQRIIYPDPASWIIQPETDATVTRYSDHRIEIHWKQMGNVHIFVGTDPGNIQREVAIAEVIHADHVIITGLDPATRYYFELAFADGKRIITAERFIYVQGTANLRDVGGYLTQNGQRVRWGKVFRSGAVTGVLQTDLSSLEALGLKVVCDLRSLEEVAESPDRLPQNPQLRYVQLPLETEDNSRDRLRAILFDKKRLEKIKLEIYTRFLIDRNAPRFGDTLRYLSNPENLPALIHCTAGKDRTGIAIALLLILLGVPEEVVIADYTLSNMYYEDFKAFAQRALKPLRLLRIKADDLYPLLIADDKTMRTALEHIRRNYGNVETYLMTKAGLSKEELTQLKVNLLEPSH